MPEPATSMFADPAVAPEADAGIGSVSEEATPAAAPFVHLRLHSDYSIRDGLVTIEPLIGRLHEMGMPAVAVTDEANLFALIKFYKAASKAGIKPLCGCDLQVVEGETEKEPTRLLLLVKDKGGYRNLSRLISDLYESGQRGYGQRPLLDKAALAGLKERGGGLIALSGAQFSDVGRALLAGDQGTARRLLDEWRAIFPDGYYLELQRVGRPDEEDYIAAALELAAEADCPVVASNDVRFLAAEDFTAHEARVCINDSRILSDPRRPRQYTEQQYLRSGHEMAELFADIPEALANAGEIARRCTLEMVLDEPSLPDYPVPAGLSPGQHLSDLAAAGLRRRLEANPAASPQDYEQRLQQELEVINQMGFAGYFLIVWEFIQWARDNNIPVGPGRGSGAGSLVAYALQITDLDPLRYDLLFERFLNPERVSMPDLDIDFCIEGRDKVIDHVAEQYGKEAVAQIITFGTMAAKAVVRDVARVLGRPYMLGDKLSKLIPPEVGMTLKKAMQKEKALADFVEEDDEAKEVMEMAYKLEGVVRQVGTHAGGVVIAPTQLTEFTPLYCDEVGGGLLTQFDKEDVETAGLVKFDFLGLRTLTVIDRAVKAINARTDAKVDIAALPLNDKAVYGLLQEGKTTAVFQLESSGMKDLLKRLLPNQFEDIIALVALYRPGPLGSGMVDDFIACKHGRQTVNYLHPTLQPVLANTHGVILYQEQVMQIARDLADYTLGGADTLRKAMGKKDPKEMANQRSTFLEGAQAKGMEEGMATRIFSLMEEFAGYGFNKSHSAAYALVAYQTAWLKARYPAYYMAAVLSSEMHDTDKIVTLIDECRSMGLQILPPDVNVGQFDFTVGDGGGIVYGLGAIKGLGQGPVRAVLDRRAEGGAFKSLMDLCQRVGDNQLINKRTLEALIKAGALDSLVSFDKADGSDGIDNKDMARALLLDSMGDAVRAAEQHSHNEAAGVDDMFGGIAPARPQSAAAPAHSSRADATNKKQRLRPWSERQRLAAEKEALGLYLSGHPVDEYLSELRQIASKSLSDLQPNPNQTQMVAGLLHDIRIRKNKSGGTMASVMLDDRSGRLEVALFSREFDRFRDLLQKGSILIMECMLTHDDYSGGLRARVRGDVMTLDQARGKRAGRGMKLTLELESAALGDGFCGHLAGILEPYRSNGSGAAGNNGGGCRLEVHYRRPDAKACIMLGQEWRVDPAEDLIQNLKSEYGRDKVELRY